MFFCQNKSEWTKIITEEEEFMSQIRHLVENHGTGLIASEHDEIDPLVLEEINALFNRNVKSIERLKHVIIYEAVRNFELTTAITVKKDVEAKMPELVEEAKRISQLDPATQRLASICKQQHLFN